MQWMALIAQPSNELDWCRKVSRIKKRNWWFSPLRDVWRPLKNSIRRENTGLCKEQYIKRASGHMLFKTIVYVYKLINQKCALLAFINVGIFLCNMCLLVSDFDCSLSCFIQYVSVCFLPTHFICKGLWGFHYFKWFTCLGKCRISSQFLNGNWPILNVHWLKL